MSSQDEEQQGTSMELLSDYVLFLKYTLALFDPITITILQI